MAGQKTRALFVSIPKDPKETTAYYNLSEGERQDGLEVVKILETEESAQVINAGTKMTVALKEDTKPPAPAQTPGRVGQIPLPPGVKAATVPTPPLAIPIPQVDQQHPDQQAAYQPGGVMVVGGSPVAQPEVVEKVSGVAPPNPTLLLRGRPLRGQIAQPTGP